eukprot:scaffold253910_cov30-Tisochrysis_lutea.AAC.2
MRIAVRSTRLPSSSASPARGASSMSFALALAMLIARKAPRVLNMQSGSERQKALPALTMTIHVKKSQRAEVVPRYT